MATDKKPAPKFLPVVGYEGRYEVSNTGDVRSRVRGGPKLLRPGINSQGYMTVVLCNNSQRQTVGVHHLVAEAFIGKRPDSYDTRHLNDVKTDNRVENLAYGTRGDNLRDRKRNGKDNSHYGSRSACSKGHRYTQETTYIYPGGGRGCRVCHRGYDCNRYWRKKGEQ